MVVLVRGAYLQEGLACLFQSPLRAGLAAEAVPVAWNLQPLAAVQDSSVFASLIDVRFLKVKYTEPCSLHHYNRYVVANRNLIVAWQPSPNSANQTRIAASPTHTLSSDIKHNTSH